MSLSLSWRCLLTVGLLLASLEPPSAAAFETVVVEGRRVVADRVLLKLQPQLQANGTSARVLAAQLALPEGATLELDGFARWQRRSRGLARPTLDEPLDLRRFLIVQLNGKMDVASALAHLRAQPGVAVAEPDGVARVGAIPNDPTYPQQWHHGRIGSPAAWDLTRGATNIIVAVVDSGIDPDSRDFFGRILPGYNFLADNDETADDSGHGTGVSTILAANGDDGRGTAGVDWNCRILPVRVIGASQLGRYSDMAAGVSYAVESGAKVINFSSGGDNDSVVLGDAVRQAVAAGVIFVTITHNDGGGVITFPGRMPESITVGSSDRNDRRALFSNYGPRVDLLAPGQDIWGTAPGSGTSYSAPIVSGAVALLLSLRPTLRQEEVRALLHAGAADQLGEASDTPGFDNFHGWGRLDLARTLQLARAQVGSPPPAPRLANVSTRGRVGLGADVLIGGLVVRGAAPKRFLFRAMGPSLTAFNVSGALADPSVEVFDAGGRPVAFNENWQDAQAAEINATGFAPSEPREAAVIVTLSPGAYTAVVRGSGGTSGVGLVEAYELNAGDEPRFINLSTRGRVGAGDDVMIAGLVITGTGPRRLLLRGLGPSLTAAGVPGALQAPMLEIVQDGHGICSNSRWGLNPDGAAISATGLAPTRAEESALLVTLAPGSYTTILRSANGGAGVGLVEIYDLE